MYNNRYLSGCWQYAVFKHKCCKDNEQAQIWFEEFIKYLGSIDEHENLDKVHDGYFHYGQFLIETGLDKQKGKEMLTIAYNYSVRDTEGRLRILAYLSRSVRNCCTEAIKCGEYGNLEHDANDFISINKERIQLTKSHADKVVVMRQALSLMFSKGNHKYKQILACYFADKVASYASDNFCILVTDEQGIKMTVNLLDTYRSKISKNIENNIIEKFSVTAKQDRESRLRIIQCLDESYSDNMNKHYPTSINREIRGRL